MKRKGLQMLLVGSMVASITLASGCGNKDLDGKQTDIVSPTPTPTETETPTPTPTPTEPEVTPTEAEDVVAPVIVEGNEDDETDNTGGGSNSGGSSSGSSGGSSSGGSSNSGGGSGSGGSSSGSSGSSNSGGGSSGSGGGSSSGGSSNSGGGSSNSGGNSPGGGGTSSGENNDDEPDENDPVYNTDQDHVNEGGAGGHEGSSGKVVSPVNMRSGPGTDYSVITELSTGDKVTVLGTSGGWLHVECNGQTGYVYGDYIG